MLIENAFHYLPEILCASNYEVQDYEAGITNALSLALLQELNARNVPNPLSALIVEKPYSKEGYPHPNGKSPNRHDRADLYFDTSGMYVANKSLSRFGWRHRNYLEAKFFRPSIRNSTNNSCDLLADIIRLCILTRPQIQTWEPYFKDRERRLKQRATPSKLPKQDRWVPYEGDASPLGEYRNLCVGRYLVHIYSGDPKSYLGQGTRTWTPTMIAPGTHPLSIEVQMLDRANGEKEEPGYVKRLAEELKDLQIDATITNRVIAQELDKDADTYFCVLTRIDSFTIKLGDLTWTETVDRIGTESKPGDWLKLNQKVGTFLNYIPKAEKSKAKEQKEAEPEPAMEPEAPAPSNTELLMFTYGPTGGTQSSYTSFSPSAPNPEPEE